MRKSSYEKIDYSIRPAKQIERKMLCEVFLCLSEFGSVKDYRYIGFGSTYFRDFILIHKVLGITNMISIEGDVKNKKRFLFNQPYSCVDIKFGHSNKMLPELIGDVRTILWLDYDYRLDATVLADISWFCTKAISGSVLIITVNAKPDKHPKDKVSEFIRRVVKTKFPRNIKGKDLTDWGTAQVSRTVIHNHIEEELETRNGGRADGSKYKYQQLFNFHYEDGAKMLSVGGILFDQGNENKYNACQFDRFSFVRKDKEPYLIKVPKLTTKEILHLDAQLPERDLEKVTGHSIPMEDIKDYSELYRYFPKFAEVDK